MNMTSQQRALKDRLMEFIQQHEPGSCKMFSTGLEGCPCPRCALDRLLQPFLHPMTPPTYEELLSRAVSDREIRPWVYYKLEPDSLKTLLDERHEMLVAAHKEINSERDRRVAAQEAITRTGGYVDQVEALQSALNTIWKRGHNMAYAEIIGLARRTLEQVWRGVKVFPEPELVRQRGRYFYRRPATPSPTSPDPSVQAPPGEERQRGIEGGVTRRKFIRP